MIAIPEGVDPSKITTGIIVDSDGTARHVPTKIVAIEGKHYARINSLTNSIYAVIYYPIEFKDIETHWAKEDIHDMASRMIISGISEEIFEPNRDITRAEFATMITRALGLKPGEGNNSFTDVNSDAWYYGYIKTAYSYGIISGYGDNKFGPMDKITREQAMTMIVNAMETTDLEIEVEDIDKTGAEYVDFSGTANWAKGSTAICIEGNIIPAQNIWQLLEPKKNVTRAETAVMIRKLLQKSDLI
ncbi:S-layer homology domain-containing protein [Natronincola peptidivorans]|uniref:S-layer homology domain-containing protein n=1 Tax=Natronincola peptidivorans TaxID=426128 RepID=A0A1I0EK23_9FIRM|nr:S-layer homology domain-containing protein [Natronincola peptidivorans]SET45009.1 S-layer homology domain-containing protein [Natronincola peptidivorans]